MKYDFDNIGFGSFIWEQMDYYIFFPVNVIEKLRKKQPVKIVWVKKGTDEWWLKESEMVVQNYRQYRKNKYWGQDISFDYKKEKFVWYDKGLERFLNFYDMKQEQGDYSPFGDYWETRYDTMGNKMHFHFNKETYCFRADILKFDEYVAAMKRNFKKRFPFLPEKTMTVKEMRAKYKINQLISILYSDKEIKVTVIGFTQTYMIVSEFNRITMERLDGVGIYKINGDLRIIE